MRADSFEKHHWFSRSTISSFPTMIRTLLATLALAVTVSAAQPPNIVFIFCDDLAYQAMSCYGDKRKLLETPNMDRLAKEGMRFDRCLVTNSICGPMRAVIQTGKYSHANGFYNNSNSKFDSSQPTFPKVLQKSGYQTAVIGKWHLMTDPVGFDYWNVLPGQGAYYNPPMTENGKQVKYEGYTTDIIGDLTLKWLDQRDKSKPFMMMSQHKAPHREWEPPLRLLGFDNDRVYEEPETLFDAYSGRSKAVSDHDMGIDRTFTERDAKLVVPGNLTEEQKKAWNAYYEPRNAKYAAAAPTGRDLVKWRYQRYMHDYLACVKAVDENVGRVLDYLDKNDLAKNTVVILSSDQGFYLGEHGWFDKRWIFEESLRSPLLARWPGVIKPGSTNNQLTSLLDFASTFLDIAQAPMMEGMHGRSLVPLMKGETPADWRKAHYYHYYEFPVPHRVRPHYGVITDRFKLIHYYAPDVNDWELLDREKDPLEVKDFYSDPAYSETVKELKAEITRLQKQFGETVPPPRFTHGNKAFDNEPQPPEQPKKGKGTGKKKKAE
jgi:arylsulfatase A-like enzyme